MNLLKFAKAGRNLRTALELAQCTAIVGLVLSGRGFAEGSRPPASPTTAAGACAGRTCAGCHNHRVAPTPVRIQLTIGNGPPGRVSVCAAQEVNGVQADRPLIAYGDTDTRPNTHTRRQYQLRTRVGATRRRRGHLGESVTCPRRHGRLDAASGRGHATPGACCFLACRGFQRSITRRRRPFFGSCRLGEWYSPPSGRRLALGRRPNVCRRARGRGCR